MPGFKPRSNRKIQNTHISTLDSIHKQNISKFKQYEEDLPKLQERKQELINTLNSLNKDSIDTHNIYIKNNKEHTDLLDYKRSIFNELTEIKSKIKLIKREKKEYYLRNSKHIFDYFLEKKEHSLNDNSNKTVLYNFFYKNKKQEQVDNIESQSAVKKYMMNMNSDNIDIDDYIISNDKCSNCKIGEIISVDSEGVNICKHCNCIQHFLIDQDKPTYKEPPKEISFFAYKRINHFREILAQFQAKESTRIDQKVIDDIKEQIKKQRLTLDQLTNDKTKSILRILGYNKYYEHIPFIKEKLGIKPPVMSLQLEQKLCSLFMEIQRPYAKFCPSKRVNFLNYYYVLYKMCELLGEDQYLKHFYLLKDPVKRMEQDEIWKKICGELNWEFIPTP